MNICRIFAVMFATVLLVSTANADVTLDDFETGDHFWTTTFDMGDTYVSEFAKPGAAGNTRLIQHTPQGNSFNQFVQTSIANGSMNIEYDSSLDGFGVIHGIYGGLIGIPASGSGAITDSQLAPICPTIDLSQESELRLSYTFNGLANSCVVSFYAFGPNIDQNQFDQTDPNTQLIFLVPGTNEAVIDFDDFFENVDPSQVAGIGFTCVALFNGEAVFHDFSATGGSSPMPASAPNEFTLERGALIAGELEDTCLSDDATIQFQRETGLSRLGPMSVVIDGVLSSDAPGAFTFEIESRADKLRINQEIQLFDWSVGDFTPIDLSQIALSDSTTTVTLTDNYLRFVEAGTGRVRTRVLWRPAPRAVIGRMPWHVDIDLVQWRE